MINILTVHYNTPELTSALVKSIYKFVPDFHLYIFDNSDKKPFPKTNDKNITIFDNTKGQIIDFDKWLENYPNRFTESDAKMNFASAKHCYTVNKCIELINENLILVDSDILLKQDISKIVDLNYCVIGNTQFYKDSFCQERMLPFLCFINVDMMNKNSIKYFDDKHMNGLGEQSGDITYYDTGAYFYQSVENKFKDKIKKIKIYDYIIHYGSASWIDIRKSKYSHLKSNQLTPEEWLKENKQLY